MLDGISPYDDVRSTRIGGVQVDSPTLPNFVGTQHASDAIQMAPSFCHVRSKTDANALVATMGRQENPTERNTHPFARPATW